MDDRNKEPGGEDVLEHCFCGEECSKDENCWKRKEIESHKALLIYALLKDGLNAAGTPNTDIGPFEVGPSEEMQTDFQIQKCSCDNKQCSNNGCECYFLAVKCNESCACNEDCLNKQDREVNKRSRNDGNAESSNKRLKIS